jgi:hypothetical protein
MTTATRNRRPRPQRSMHVGTPCRGCFAFRLTVGKASASYFVEPIAGAAFGTAAFRLVKFVQDVQDGEPDHYDVNLDTAHVTRSTCECTGFLKHGWHLDADGKLVSCKHVDSLLKLAAEGKLALPRQQAAAAAARADLDDF